MLEPASSLALSDGGMASAASGVGVPLLLKRQASKGLGGESALPVFLSVKKAKTASTDSLPAAAGSSEGGASAAAGADPSADGLPEVGDCSPSVEPATRYGHPLLDGCRNVERFKKLNRIDEGTYGVVFRARDTETDEIIALKQLKLNAAKSDDGFPVPSLREISLLLDLHHPNVVRCREIVVGKSLNHVFMVMDYIEHELKVVLDRHVLTVAEVKCLLRQLLDAMQYVHDRWVVHRDLKTTNILLNNCGGLKVCDFGLARHYGDPLRPMTQRVQSLWYRAPELLLGQKRYSPCVDVWSVGCIFAEMFLRKPIFEGKIEIHQLQLIFETTGVPSEETWPDFEKLPNWKTVPFKLSLPRWRIIFPEEDQLTDVGLELLRSLLECCPERRTSAIKAYEDPYFWEAPYPQEASMMPTFQESNNEGRRFRGSQVGRVGNLGGSNALSGAGLRGAANRGGPPPFVKMKMGE